jgi:FemAB-related protein (PEP-CTERM system-associated)
VRVEPFHGSAREWDAFVRASTGWTHYHLAGWRTLIARHFGHECPYLVARDDAGALTGVLPLVRVRSALFGHYLVSMPFLNYGGPLGSARAVAALAQHAAELAERTGADLLELRSPTELPIGLPASHRKITVVLDLEDGVDAQWARLPAKLRSQIKRPRKEGVTVRFGADQVGAFFDVFARHMRDLGTPAHSRQLFERIATEFSDSVWFGVAYLGDLAIAGGCGFQWGRELELVWAAALREHNRIAPNMLLYWQFIERCVEQGIRRFNFGRCTPGSGTHRFKQQWGGRDEALWWYQQGRGKTQTPSPNDARFRWGPRIWQKLPVPVTTMLGPHLVRYLP